MVNTKEVDSKVSQVDLILEQRILAQVLNISPESIDSIKKIEARLRCSESVTKLAYTSSHIQPGRLMLSVYLNCGFEKENILEYCTRTFKDFNPESIRADHSLNPNHPGVNNKVLNGYHVQINGIDVYLRPSRKA